jgi:hypothetical protein
MKKSVAGIWIDTRKAYVVKLSGEKPVVTTIPSGVERMVRFPGETAPKINRGAEAFDYESKNQAHYHEELRRFYRHVIQEVGQPSSLFIAGPAEAKFGLENEMRKTNLENRIADVATTDQLTSAEFVKLVEKFYQPVHKHEA